MIGSDSHAISHEQRPIRWLALLPTLAAFVSVLGVGSWLSVETFQRQSADAIMLTAAVIMIALPGIELAGLAFRKADRQQKLERFASLSGVLFPVWIGLLLLLTLLKGRL